MKKIAALFFVFWPILIFAQQHRLPPIMASFKDDSYSDIYEMISDNIEYPLPSKRMCHQGSVFVQFVVRKDGSVDEIKCINHIDDFIDAEVIRIIKLTDGKWEPALMDDEIFDSRMSLTIVFNHQNERCEQSRLEYLKAGIEYFNKQKYKKAIKELYLAHLNGPTDKETLRYLSLCYIRLNDLTSACEYLERLKNEFDEQGIKDFEKYCKN